MNILHMKYAVEVAKVGSLNKAAESLYVALPNISRSIKELEADLGISIFNRSAKGMELTPEGEEFIGYEKPKKLEAMLTYILDKLGIRYATSMGETLEVKEIWNNIAEYFGGKE